MCSTFIALLRNFHTLVNTASEKLEMVPPVDGGIDSQGSLQLFVSPVTTQYRNRSESLNDYTAPDMHRVTHRIVPTNPDKLAMIARKGNIKRVCMYNCMGTKEIYNYQNIFVRRKSHFYGVIVKTGFQPFLSL